jgi:hypothetical protein
MKRLVNIFYVVGRRIRLWGWGGWVRLYFKALKNVSKRLDLIFKICMYGLPVFSLKRAVVHLIINNNKV